MKKWLPVEDEDLDRLYPDRTIHELVKHFKRSEDSINRRANRLHLNKAPGFFKLHYNSTLKKYHEEVDEMRKDDLKEYVGKDKIVGRPVRLNIQVLEANRNGTAGKYATVKFFGDWHWGARECDRNKVRQQADYCLQEKIYVFLMGDLLEAATRGSVGAGVYHQIMNPQQQMEEVIELLRPLAEAKLIIGCLMGNHEFRIEKDTSINVTKVICNFLKIPYLGSACWNLFKVGDQYYKVYALHGASGSRYVYTKIKALVDISHNFSADLIAMGHVHDVSDTIQIVQYVDLRNKMIIERKKYLVLTGHYLSYDRSYAQDKGMPIGKMGSPNVKFFLERHDLHVSS
jgi:hypothetical protein